MPEQHFHAEPARSCLFRSFSLLQLSVRQSRKPQTMSCGALELAGPRHLQESLAAEELSNRVISQLHLQPGVAQSDPQQLHAALALTNAGRDICCRHPEGLGLFLAWLDPNQCCSSRDPT